MGNHDYLCFYLQAKQRCMSVGIGGNQCVGRGRVIVAFTTSRSLWTPAVNKPKRGFPSNVMLGVIGIQSMNICTMTTPIEKQSPFGYHLWVFRVSGGMYPGVPTMRLT